jgi:DNA-binding response OmpR family regulator
MIAGLRKGERPNVMSGSENLHTIMVVDDETVIADTLTQILERNGYAAYAAYDAESAIEAALLMPPELVISDVMLPGINGVELGIKIRRIFPGCNVILFSGQSRSRDLLTAALTAGSHFLFIEKPIHPTVLMERVSENFKPRTAPSSKS